jgi:hypothetical protein
MASVETAIIKASFETVWNLLTNLYTWEQWNPDIYRVEDIDHKGRSFGNGTSCTFYLEPSYLMCACASSDNDSSMDGPMLRGKIYNFVSGKHFAVAATGLGRLFRFEASVQVQSLGARKTKVTYSLGAEGFMGPIVSMCYAENMRLSVELGLEILSQLAEETERTHEAMDDLTFGIFSSFG